MSVIARRYIGQADDGVAGEHFMTCPACGVRFDMRDMAQMFEHWHDGPEDEALPTVDNGCQAGYIRFKR